MSCSAFVCHQSRCGYDAWAFTRYRDTTKICVSVNFSASFISQITTLCNYVPPLLWLMCRNNPKRGGTDRHEIHETARYRHCSPRPHCRASVSGSGCVRGDHSDSQVLSRLAAVRLQTAVA